MARSSSTYLLSDSMEQPDHGDVGAEAEAGVGADVNGGIRRLRSYYDHHPRRQHLCVRVMRVWRRGRRQIQIQIRKRRRAGRAPNTASMTRHTPNPPPKKKIQRPGNSGMGWIVGFPNCNLFPLHKLQHIAAIALESITLIQLF